MDNKDFEIIRSKLRDYNSPLDQESTWITCKKKLKGSGAKMAIVRSSIVVVVLLLFVWGISEKNKALLLSNESDTRGIESEINESDFGGSLISQFGQDTVGSIKTDIKPLVHTYSNVPTSSLVVENILPNKSSGLFINWHSNVSKSDVGPLSEVISRQHSYPINFENSSNAAFVPRLNFRSMKTSLHSFESVIRPDLLNKNAALETLIIEVKNTNKEAKHQSISIAYNYGVKDFGLKFDYFARGPNGDDGFWQPHGHSSLLFGYQYNVSKKLAFQGAFSAGMGYLNQNQSVSGSVQMQFINVSQKEWALELMPVFVLFSHLNLDTEVGVGGFYRNFRMLYEAGPENEIVTSNQVVLPGETGSFLEQTVGGQCMVRFKYKVSKVGAVNLGGFYQFSSPYKRHSLRLGYTYLLKIKH